MSYHAARYEGKLVGVFPDEAQAQAWARRPWADDVSWAYDAAAWTIRPARFDELVGRAPLGAAFIGIVARELGRDGMAMLGKALCQYVEGDDDVRRYVEDLIGTSGPGRISWNAAEDLLTCTCGNVPESDGFYSADARTGDEVDPVLGGTWDGVTWVCGRCGAYGVPAKAAR